MNHSRGELGLSSPSGASDVSDNVFAHTAFNDRRVVSLLFADIVGSTRAIASMDPEDAQVFLDQAVGLMVRNVHALGGSVARIQGDGIMAIFGAPYVLEDHAARAVLAGLALQADAAREAGAQLRVGIHSGPVIVRWQQNDFGRELDSIGTTVHLAAHIESLCAPGAVAISGETRKLLKGHVTAKALAATLPDKHGQQLKLYEISAYRPAEALSSTFFGSHFSRLVGRVEQLAQTARFVDTVAADGQGRLAIVGEAGFGKSRLAFEAAQMARRKKLAVQEMRGSSIKSDTPFAPVASLLAQLGFGARYWAEESAAGETGLTPLQKLGMRSLFYDVSRDAVWMASAADERIRAIVSGAIMLVRAAARATPMLLIVEDLHFMDTESRHFIQHLAADAADVSVGILLTARPEAGDIARDICAGVIAASPLGADDARQFIQNEYEALAGTGGAPLADALVSEIVQRADGCPLALEELLRIAMLPRGDEAFDSGALPLSLETMMRARLGKLDPTARRVVEAASVAGPSAPTELVKAIAGLGDDQFYEGVYALVEQRIVSISEQGRVQFAHQLLMDACYSGMVRPKRQELHGTALAVLRDRQDRRAVPYQELARHAYAAGDQAQATKFIWHACVAAIGSAAIYTVADLYRRAVKLCEGMDADGVLMQAKFTLLVFDAFQQLGRQGELRAALEDSIRVFEGLGEEAMLIQAKLHLATVHWIAGEQDQARTYVAESYDIPLLKASFPLESYAEFTLANVDYASGAPVTAVERLRKLVQWHSGERELSRFGAMISVPGVMSRAFLGWYATDIGAYEEAEAMLQRAAELGDKLQQGYSIMLAALGFGYLRYRMGRDDAIEKLMRGQRLCRTQSYFGLEPIGSGFLAAALIRAGREGEAGAVLVQSAADGHSRRTANAGNYYLMESAAYLAFRRGNADAALSRIGEAVAFTERNGDRVHHAYALAAEADLLHETGADKAVVGSRLQKAKDLADGMGMAPLSAQMAERLAL